MNVGRWVQHARAALERCNGAEGEKERWFGTAAPLAPPESRAMGGHDILIRSDGGCWRIKLILFVGGTSGSVHVKTFRTLNDNLTELQVIESKRNAIRKGLVYC